MQAILSQRPDRKTLSYRPVGLERRLSFVSGLANRMMPFREFWPLYLHAHRRRTTRAAHYAGVIFGTAMAVLAIVLQETWPLLCGIAGAFVVTVGSHWVFEHNRPLLAVNPLWGVASDLRMLFLAATGRLARELARHGVDNAVAARDIVSTVASGTSRDSSR
jgi:hypothetical protein